MWLQRLGLRGFEAQHINTETGINFGKFHHQKRVYPLGVTAGAGQTDIKALHGLVTAIGLQTQLPCAAVFGCQLATKPW